MRIFCNSQKITLYSHSIKLFIVIYVCVCIYTRDNFCQIIWVYIQALLLTIPSQAHFTTSLYLSYFKCRMKNIVSIILYIIDIK